MIINKAHYEFGKNYFVFKTRARSDVCSRNQHFISQYHSSAEEHNIFGFFVCLLFRYYVSFIKLEPRDVLD